MSEDKNRVGCVLEASDSSTPNTSEFPDRRKFLLQAGAAATVAAGVLAAPSVASAQSSDTDSLGGVQHPGPGSRRVRESFENRVNAATREALVPVPRQITNGDERNFPNYIGNFSKGLVHNSIGEVLSSSYQSFLAALNSGNPSLFEQIQLGGNTLLVDPQAGLAFDLEEPTRINWRSERRHRWPAGPLPMRRSRTIGWRCAAT